MSKNIFLDKEEASITKNSLTPFGGHWKLIIPIPITKKDEVLIPLLGRIRKSGIYLQMVQLNGSVIVESKEDTIPIFVSCYFENTTR